MKYGYIGLGNLGGHLAASLLRNGFDVTVNDIDKNLGARHLKAGGKWADTPKALAEKVIASSPACRPPPYLKKFSPKSSKAWSPGQPGLKCPPSAVMKFSALQNLPQ